MKNLISILFLSILCLAPDLSKVRTDYREAASSEETTKKLYEDLIAVGINDDMVLVAYKGAVNTMMSKFAEDIKDKKTFFKDGRELLEYAVVTAPESVEIRCIRLSVQENAPKIVGYRKNIEADKQFILDNYASLTDTGAKEFVKGYAQQSDAFSDAEKQLF